MNEYFVILNTQRGGACALLDDDDELMIFDAETDARDAAESTVAGSHFGYELFIRGEGRL